MQLSFLCFADQCGAAATTCTETWNETQIIPNSPNCTSTAPLLSAPDNADGQVNKVSLKEAQCRARRVCTLSARPNLPIPARRTPMSDSINCGVPCYRRRLLRYLLFEDKLCSQVISVLANEITPLVGYICGVQARNDA